MSEHPTIACVQAVVAQHFRMRMLDMVSRRRGRSIARPRQVAMWIARHTTLASLPEIGRAFGGRDHTTVIHAIRVVDHLMWSRPEFAAEVWTAVETVDSVESVNVRRAMMRMVA